MFVFSQCMNNLKYLNRVEELSVTVSKEYALEKAMTKMKEEWQDIEFEFKPYRETVSAYIYISICIL